LKASELFQSAEKSNIAIKAFLMNQKKILGIGNIYACEILHAIGVNPFKKANRISIQNWKKLCRAAKSILQKATAQRGTTVSDWADLYGNQGTYQKYLKVYGREGCACCRCGMPIVRFKINGRGTYYCSTCQPE
jgi:formamidopyrimidine-DNA glycosylase